MIIGSSKERRRRRVGHDPARPEGFGVLGVTQPAGGREVVRHAGRRVQVQRVVAAAGQDLAGVQADRLDLLSGLLLGKRQK
jgi:hypothetical protein